MAEHDQQIARAVELLRGKLHGYRERNDIGSENAYARFLGIPWGTLRHILREGVLPYPKTFEKICRRVPFTEDEAKQIETAFSRRTSLSRSRGRLKQAAARSDAQSVPRDPSRPQTLDALRTELDELSARVARLEGERLGQTEARGNREVPCGSYAQLLSGEGMERYDIGNLPHVLTAENFQPVEARRWTSAQQEHFQGYLAFLVDTLRKYLNVLAQLGPEEKRKGILAQLHRRFNELWRSFKVATSVNPPKCVEIMELEEDFATTAQPRRGSTSTDKKGP